MQETSEILWQPPQSLIESSYVTKFMKKHGIRTRNELWKRSVADLSWFWDEMMKEMGIQWFTPYRKVLDDSEGIEWTKWFLDGKTNLVLNCIDRHLSTTLAKKEAIVWEGDGGETRTLTYTEFNELVCKAANALTALGVKEGETVGILMPMIPEVVVQLFACFKIGAVAIPVFSGFGQEAIATRFSLSKAKVVFTCDVSFRRGKPIDIKKTADLAADLCTSVEKLIVYKRGDGTCPWNAKRDLWWDEFVLKQSPKAETKPLPSEARSMLLFTSGTTGTPKGAVHTHAGAIATIGKELRYAFNTDENSRFFWFTDIGWMMGPWEMIGVTLFGGTLFLFDGAPDYPDPSRLWQLIDRHKITALGISPTAIRLLMKSGDDPFKNVSLNSLQLLGSTGEPWDPQSYKWFFEKVGKKRCPIINISGGTEIVGCLLSPLPIDPLKPCSLGGPGLGVDADVFDESGNSVQGGIGHLVCKKPLPSMTKGFLNSKERYIETYFSKWKGVWYHGDWAHIDDDGFWFLHGRSDDTIKVAGKRVGPVEYEAAIMKSGKAAEVAAVGVPDSLKGEVCVCYVVLKPGEKISPELRSELHQATIAALGKSLAPKEIRFTTLLPKTRSGKILRGLIRKIYLNETIQDTSSVENLDALQSIKHAE